jgi:hypothetical protein
MQPVRTGAGAILALPRFLWVCMRRGAWLNEKVRLGSSGKAQLEQMTSASCPIAEARLAVSCAPTASTANHGPHQFRTRNDPTNQHERDRFQSLTKSTRPTVFLSLITVWLQVRVLPGPPAFAREASEGCRAEAPLGEGGLGARATARQATSMGYSVLFGITVPETPLPLRIVIAKQQLH